MTYEDEVRQAVISVLGEQIRVSALIDVVHLGRVVTDRLLALGYIAADRYYNCECTCGCC